MTTKLPIHVTRRIINSSRNSTCALQLSQLDWSSWYSDHSFGRTYLMVKHLHHNEYYPVYCRSANGPKLMFDKGRLFWLIRHTPIQHD